MMSQAAHVQCLHDLCEYLDLHREGATLHGLEVVVPVWGTPDEELEVVPLHCHVLQGAQPVLPDFGVLLQTIHCLRGAAWVAPPQPQDLDLAPCAPQVAEALLSGGVYSEGQLIA